MAGDGAEKTVARLGRLLWAVAEAPGAAVSDVVRQADAPRSSSYRLFAELEDAGLLERSGGGLVLGRTAQRIGLSAYGHGELAPIVEPVLTRLGETTGRSAGLGFTRGDDADVAVGPSLNRRGHPPAPRRFKISSTERSDAPQAIRVESGAIFGGRAALWACVRPLKPPADANAEWRACVFIILAAPDDPASNGAELELNAAVERLETALLDPKRERQ